MNIKIKKYLKERYKVIIVIVVLLTMSVTVAAYDEKMLITGMGAIRVDADVRVTGITAKGNNGGFETYNAKYGKESVYLYTSLPDNNSTVTYTVTINNKTNKLYIIYAMNTKYSSGSTDIECNVANELKAIGKGIQKNGDTTIDITCKYKNGFTNKTQITTIDFDFEIPTAEMLSYDNIQSGSSCQNVKCALDDLYKILGG